MNYADIIKIAMIAEALLPIGLAVAADIKAIFKNRNPAMTDDMINQAMTVVMNEDLRRFMLAANTAAK